MKKIPLIFTLILCSILSACQVMETENDLMPIESTLTFSIYNKKADNPANRPGYFILLRTEKIYNCANYEIEAIVSVNFNQITIQLLGIDQSGICATSEGPATAYIPLDISDGKYLLEIGYSSSRDRYSVSFDTSEFSVSQIDSDFTRYEYIGVKTI